MRQKDFHIFDKRKKDCHLFGSVDSERERDRLFALDDRGRFSKLWRYVLRAPLMFWLERELKARYFLSAGHP